jgi:transposase-like protein
MTPSTARATPSAAERGATRRGSSGLTPNEALVVVLLQQGKTVAAVAEEIGVSQRQVRRLRASARRHGAPLDPPRSVPQDAATGAFTGKKPARGRARIFTIEEGATEATITAHRYEEDPERRRARTGGDGRMTLGVEAAPGEVADPMGDGRRMVKVAGATIADFGPRQDAVSGWARDQDAALRIEAIRANAPPGAVEAYDPDTGEWIDL